MNLGTPQEHDDLTLDVPAASLQQQQQTPFIFSNSSRKPEVNEYHDDDSDHDSTIDAMYHRLQDLKHIPSIIVPPCNTNL